MTPEPTPVSGMIPLLVSALPETVIRTTAGLTLDATSMVADCSSMVTGWLALTFVPLFETGAAPVRSSAPVADRATTVPPEARIADSAAARTTEPVELRPVRPAVVVVLVGGVATGVVDPADVTGAGSYQRSGVTAGASSGSWRVQTGRGSGAGE